jgi:hypothetical protein
LADTGNSARAEEAQVARERALRQRGEAQRAALLEQAEEEKKTAQQARLASIREQQAALVRWFSAMRVEAKKKLAEAQLAATEGLALEEGPKQLQRESAELKEPGEPAELEEPGEPAELKEPGEPAELGEPEVPGGPAGPGEPRESAELKELQGMWRAREGGTAAEEDTVRVRREAERLPGMPRWIPATA